jgi:hypothetical protein
VGVVIYRVGDFSGQVSFSLTGVRPDYDWSGTSGNTYWEDSKFVWQGEFPSEGPIEVWMHVPEGAVPFRGYKTFTCEVGDLYEVEVFNPLWGSFVPLVIR